MRGHLVRALNCLCRGLWRVVGEGVVVAKELLLPAKQCPRVLRPACLMHSHVLKVISNVGARVKKYYKHTTAAGI